MTEIIAEHSSSYATYQRGCRCDGCKEASREYGRKWYSKNRERKNSLARARYQPKSKPTLEDRFWAKVDKRGPDECWSWLGASNAGYGLISDGTGKHLRATRASIIIHYGSFDNSLVVCHKCDNPPCVNPDHLFLGTLKNNMQDMHSKNRGYAKLTIQQREEIARRYVRGTPHVPGNSRELAEEYGVSTSRIQGIVREYRRKSGVCEVVDGVLVVTPDESEEA